jgi:hypothetical protein
MASDLDDLVLLRRVNGGDIKITWCSFIDARDKCSLILVKRMPLTREENMWFWYTLPGILAPGASIKFGSGF